MHFYSHMVIHCIIDHLTGTPLRVEEGAINNYTGTTGGSRDLLRQTGIYVHATTAYASKSPLSVHKHRSFHLLTSLQSGTAS